METAADIIKRSDRDVTKRNKRVKKLTHERIQIKNRSLRKLVKKTKINELERKIEMIDRMNEKELAVKTQKVTEFCGLREAILTIMTNEEKLKPEDINLLIENAMHSEPKTERKKTPRKPKHHQSARPQLKDINKLVDSGNKKQWKRYITNNIKNKIKMKFPQLEPAKYKISDYGYRQFIELIIESPDFLRLISEVRDVSGFDVVRLNYLMRGDDPTLRGVEALCTLLINKEIRYDPVSETDFKYLNIIFHSFSLPKKEGINKTWNIKTENKKIQITAIFNKEDREWIYTLVQS